MNSLKRIVCGAFRSAARFAPTAEWTTSAGGQTLASADSVLEAVPGVRVVTTRAHTCDWDWKRFQGSAEALNYNRRDLVAIDTVLQFVPGRTAAVQAGGNLGIFPKYLAKHFQTVYTFEPDPSNFAKLCANAPESNIVKLQAAVGDDGRLVATSRSRRDGKPNAHEGITHIAGPGVLPTLAIDYLQLPVCDLIYLDVEGYELFALIGSIDTLTRCRPVVVLEINRNIEFVGLTGEDVTGWLTTHGYRHAQTLGSDCVFVPLAQ